MLGKSLPKQDLGKKLVERHYQSTGRIGRGDRGYFGRHIWAPQITLGGHARRCKLILGKEGDQRTLHLPVSHPAV